MDPFWRGELEDYRGEGPMITVRRNHERHRQTIRGQTVWLTFFPRDQADLRADNFGALTSLSESRLRPGASAPRHLHHKTEILTYVREGALVYEDSADRIGWIEAGEFQCTTAAQTIRRREKNASLKYPAQVFQIWLSLPRAKLEPNQEQKRFGTGQRRGRLCLVASPDARSGSLRVHHDAFVYSALLNSGQHLVHEMEPGRCSWLHMVTGEAKLGEVLLSNGDGAAITSERAVSLTAQEEAEILLLDVLDPSLPESP